MPYAEYPYYRAVYGGALPEADFTRLSRQASAYLDELTQGRIHDLPPDVMDKVRNACCAVAEEMHRQEQGGEVASESVGAWSRSFAASGKTPPQRLRSAARLYLSQTDLLYRGVNG